MYFNCAVYLYQGNYWFCFVLWRACNHLKVINLFLFYRSADDLVYRRCRRFYRSVVIVLHYNSSRIIFNS